MEKFGLLGKKLGHSLSPFIHNLLFEANGISAEYKLYETQNVGDFLKENCTLAGFNITIPYKKAIVQYCSGLHSSAQSLGVVNCVDKNRVGFNTDVYGYTKSVSEICPNFDCKILLLGCGGVGSMIAKQYNAQNLTIAIRNLNDEKVENIKKEFGAVEVVDIANIKGGQFDLIVNSTPCGMYPNVAETPIDENVVKMAKACYDTIYNPYDTKLLKIAQKSGLKCKNGLDMLVFQAAKSHEYWYGGAFKESDINEIIRLTAKELNK